MNGQFHCGRCDRVHVEASCGEQNPVEQMQQLVDVELLRKHLLDLRSWNEQDWDDGGLPRVGVWLAVWEAREAADAIERLLEAVR